MARTKFKWKLAIFSYLILVNVFTKSLPLARNLPSLITTDTVFKNAEIPNTILKSRTAVIEDEVTVIVPIDEIQSEGIFVNSTEAAKIQDEIQAKELPNFDNSTEATDEGHIDIILNGTANPLLRQDIRPGQTVRSYAIEISPGNNANQFRGRAVINVGLTSATREDPIVLHAVDLNIESVFAGIFNEQNAVAADYSVDDDGFIEIEPAQIASTYILIINYTGRLTSAGQGLYRGGFDELDYIAMNLHPTNARRVFPCMDEPTEASIISFTFNGFEYSNFVSNSMQEQNNLVQFRPMEGPPHLWSMVGHNFTSMNSPTNNVHLYVRQETNQQDLSYASLAVNYYFEFLTNWTESSFFDIHANQNPELSIIAFPDVSVDWYGLTVAGIWEPYVVMENLGSIKQRSIGLEKIAEALSRQWFGHVIYPENWQYEWVVSGLASYAAWEALREFQDDPDENTMLDINTLFVTEIIQESLYRDSYAVTLPLETGSNLFDEADIREMMNGIIKYKTPALFRMLRLMLGDEEQDFVQLAARSLLSGRALQTVDSLLFEDAINSEWQSNGNGIVDEFEEFLRPWTLNNGYPLVHVGLRSGGVQLTQRRFSFSGVTNSIFEVPITFSRSRDPEFDNIRPLDSSSMLDAIMNVDMLLDEDDGDYALFNVQGQGYYRVNYDDELWERIIEALEDPDSRQQIHPLNRATLIDDALNIARTSILDYDIALRVVLTMEHETEYAPWRAFIRNMDFLRKRLVAMVEEDDDLDPDIYLRMVRRAIPAFEREIGFSPDPNRNEPAMVSLTRGMVMDHACRANYDPCIAAAIDWFWDPDDNEAVNPNIPGDIRPAVFCTSVREGGADIISALTERLEDESNLYERLVILESMACSSDSSFINQYLVSTLGSNSPYTPEEGLRIFKAVAGASYQNARLALNFMTSRTEAIMSRYGGNAKLEEALYALGQNLADDSLANDFYIWVDSQNNRLEDSNGPANRTANMALEDLDWQNTYLEEVYEWIDENDAATIFVSSVLIVVSTTIAVFNY